MKLTKIQKARTRWARDPKSYRRAGFWPFVIQLAIFVVLELVRPKPKIENAKASSLGDFQFPTATEGRVVPAFWGTVRMDGPNVVWYGDLVQEPITEKVKTGLFSSQTVTTGYRYLIGMQMAFALGDDDEEVELLGFWIGDDQVADYTSSPVTHNTTFTVDDPELFGGDEHGTGGFEGTFRFFAGRTDQVVSSYLQAFQLEGGDTPAYRGICYIAPDTAPAWVGNSTTIKPWKFELRRIPNPLGLTGGNDLVNGFDANPANVLYEIMTNRRWGLGYDASVMNISNFGDAGDILFDEGNGFSYLIDSKQEASDVIRLIEEQINGVVRFNHATGLWELKLIRADYTPGTLPEINEGNRVELVSFSRGSWEGTQNQVRVQFVDRSDEYKTTYAMAQDSANDRILDTVTAATVNYPGVKNSTLANNLAWRDLRGFAYPLAKATIIVDRTFWDTLAGDALEFTHDYLGIDRLAMRVTKIDFGELDNNRIRLELLQDIFYEFEPSFSDPTGTGWVPPVDNIVAFPSDQQRAFEVPAAIASRDPFSPGVPRVTVMGMGRRPGSAIDFSLRYRHAAGTPSGSYTEGEVGQEFLLIGQLNADLGKSATVPQSNFLVNSTPDTQAALIAAFAQTNPTEMGTSLVNLILIDDEFMLVETVQINATEVQFNNVYRGVLDSVQADHAADADVFVMQAGAVLSADDLPETDNVDVILIPQGFGIELSEASATVIAFAMDRRLRRPYAPSQVDLNGTAWDTTAVSLEGDGSAAEDYHVNVDIYRRDHEVGINAGNEIAQLAVDTPSTGFSLDHQIEVRHDPSGTNDLITAFTAFSGANYSLNRIDVLQALSGAVPTGDLQVLIRARHTESSDVLTSRHTIDHEFAIATTLTGQFEFGLLGASDISTLYTATVNGTYVFTLSSAFSGGSGDIEYRLNGGSWTSLITYGGTSGSIVGVVSTDTIEVRNLATDTGYVKQLDMAAAGAGQDAFAILEP